MKPITVRRGCSSEVFHGEIPSEPLNYQMKSSEIKCKGNLIQSINRFIPNSLIKLFTGRNEVGPR